MKKNSTVSFSSEMNSVWVKHCLILEKEIQKLSSHFDTISIELTEQSARTSNLAGTISKAEIQAAEGLRSRLNSSFIISMALLQLSQISGAAGQVKTINIGNLLHELKETSDEQETLRSSHG